jgi:hypothetical protein
LADGWISYGGLTLEAALQLREQIEKLRVEAGTAARPFEYYLRLDTPTPEEADRFAGEGFSNLIFWVDAFWPRGAETPLEAKREALVDAARRFGLRAPSTANPAAAGHS